MQDPGPEIEPLSPAVEAWVLTTGLLGKSEFDMYIEYLLCAYLYFKILIKATKAGKKG